MKMIKLLWLGIAILYFRWSPSMTMQIIKSYLHWAALALKVGIKVFQVKNHNIQGSF